MGRSTMTDKGVAALKPKATPYTKSGPEMRGHYVRVLPSGSKAFVVITRDPNGKQVWATIGNVGVIDIDAAREQGRAKIKAIKSGTNRAGPQSFQAVAGDWLKRHVENKGLRSKPTIKHFLENHILPAWGAREFTSIRRGDVAKLLDKIEDSAGARSADYALAVIRGICNWYTVRNDDYSSPIVKGMRRTNPKERERDRVLDDGEIRAIWKQAESNGTFGGIVRLLLLTGQRRETVAAMRWQDISIDGTWSIPSEDRAKGTGGELVLPEIALEVIKAQPKVGDYVFAGRDRFGHFDGYSKGKRAFDAKVVGIGEVAPWRLHDLRRTARSLMARAGIAPDVAERVLGHAIGGVAGIYNRHEYKAEKADALRDLAGVIDIIINPPAANVRHLRGGSKSV